MIFPYVEVVRGGQTRMLPLLSGPEQETTS